MATREDYKQALLKAHRNGDHRAAELFKNKINELPVEQVPVSAGQPDVQSVPQQPASQQQGINPARPTGDLFMAASDSFFNSPAGKWVDEKITGLFGIDRDNPPEFSPEAQEAVKDTIRSFGLAADDAVKGVSSLPVQASNLITELVINRAIKHSTGSEFRFEPITEDDIDEVLKTVGFNFPKPETDTEELVSNINKAAVGAMTGSGAAKLVEKVSSGTTRAVAKSLGAKAFAGAVGAGVGESAKDLAEKSGAGKTTSAIIGLGAEILTGMFTGKLGDIGKKSFQKLTPEGREQLAAAETLKDVEATGVSKELLGSIKDKMDLEKVEFKKAGLEEPLGTQLMASGKTQSIQRPQSELLEAGLHSEALSKKVAGELARQQSSAKEGLQQIFGDQVDENMLDSLAKIRKTASTLLKHKNIEKSELFSPKYEEVFRGVKSVKVKQIKDNIQGMLADAPESTPIRTELQKVLKQLDQSPESVDAVGALPAGNIPPRVLQKVKQALDDIQKLPGDKSLTPTVKRNALKIKNQIDSLLNSVSQGKYGKVNKEFAKFAEDMKSLSKGRIGKASDLGDDDLGTIISNTFKPLRPDQVAISKRFVENLNKVDPEAFEAMYNSYFASRLSNVIGKENPASSVLKEVFGNEQGGSNLVLSFAKNPDQRRRLSAIKKLLEYASKLEGSSNPAIAAARESSIRDRKGLKALFGELITYPRAAVKSRIQTRSQLEKIEQFARLALDDKWAKQFDEILKLPAGSKEQYSKAKAVINSMTRNESEE